MSDRGMRPIQAALDGTDWELLDRQKVALIESIAVLGSVDNPDNPIHEQRIEYLDGLVQWIDAIQDSSEKAGFPVVFLSID